MDAAFIWTFMPANPTYKNEEIGLLDTHHVFHFFHRPSLVIPPTLPTLTLLILLPTSIMF